MSNNLEGTIEAILPLQSGVSKSGKEWKSQDIVIKTNEVYPKTVCVTLKGDTIDKYQELLKVGFHLEFAIDIESREYNGRYFTTVKAYKIEKVGESSVQQNMQQMDQAAQQFFNSMPTPQPTPQPQPAQPRFQPQPNPQGGYTGATQPYHQNVQGMQGYSQPVAPQPNDSLPF